MEISKWVGAVWGIVGILLFLSGFVAGNVVTMVVGIAVSFGYVSSYLAAYVRSDHWVKRALELVFAIVALGVIVYGYIVTGSLVLGVMTIFIVVMMFIGFTLSYLLPRIRGELSERDEVRKCQFSFGLCFVSVGLFLMLDILYPGKLVRLFSAVGKLIAWVGVFSALKWRSAEKSAKTFN